jgi:perosamine synthetase
MSISECIPWAKPDFWGEEQQYVNEALASTWISGGPFVERFEKEFAEYCGASFAAAASNGTTALHMAFLALDVGPGDEIIVPGFAFMAAANVALHMGAKPVFTEVDPATWCMTAGHVEPHLSPRTKAIVPVHTYGNICPMDDILSLVDGKGVPVVEDAAEAFASQYRNCLAGTLGCMGAFSFQATKTITTGEGGMVITNSRELLDRMCLFRSHGMLRTRYWHEVAGHNFRLTNLQAALGCAQLKNLGRIIEERNRVYRCYRQLLANSSGTVMQHFAVEVNPVVWAVAVRLEPEAFPQGRDAVIHQLRDAHIETRNGFYAASYMTHLYGCPKLPVCEGLSDQVISLPTYPTLADDQIEYVCSTLKRLRR